MQLFQLIIVTLFSVAITLTANVSWANEDITTEGITTDGSSLQGIDSTNSSNSFWGIDGEDNETIALPSSPPVTIERDDSYNDIFDLLNQEPRGQGQEKLDSNYGDVPSRGGAVPFIDF